MAHFVLPFFSLPHTDRLPSLHQFSSFIQSLINCKLIQSSPLQFSQTLPGLPVRHSCTRAKKVLFLPFFSHWALITSLLADFREYREKSSRTLITPISNLLTLYQFLLSRGSWAAAVPVFRFAHGSIASTCVNRWSLESSSSTVPALLICP